MEQNNNQKRGLIGLLILAVGVAILLKNLDILSPEISRYLISWKLILIGLGTIFLFSRDKKGAGILLIVFGGALYLKEVFHFDYNFWQLFWPGMLILAGVLIIFHRRIDHPRCHGEGDFISDEDFIDEVNVFGGNEKSIYSQNFKGGRVLAVFGGSTFNLTHARLAPGSNTMEITAVFGGMKFIVPEDWSVRIEVTSVFGGFTDKHRLRRPNDSSNPTSELVIRGIALFGGGELKSF
ncbi:MAG: hypothetical protein JW801_15560 [Bacteroidales bacterium]|nr:hypothetical protein [Bacteroidales bacterium]